MSVAVGRRSFLIAPLVALAGGLDAQLGAMRLEFRGIGPVRIGMTEAQVRGAWHQKMERSELEEDCSYLIPADKGLMFMLRNSRIARVDITGGTWLTEAGAGIGTSEAELRRLYPQVRVEQHPYFDESEGHYFRVIPATPELNGYELLFETEKGAVTSFRAGLSRAVALIEGCA